MTTYFVVRDENKYGDVATVWNFRLRDWAWDVDAYYTAADGFEYTTKDAAKARVHAIRVQERANPHLLQRKGREASQNVRVVTRAELFELRECRDHSGGRY